MLFHNALFAVVYIQCEQCAVAQPRLKNTVLIHNLKFKNVFFFCIHISLVDKTKAKLSDWF